MRSRDIHLFPINHFSLDTHWCSPPALRWHVEKNTATDRVANSCHRNILKIVPKFIFFTAHCYASTLYDVILCPPIHVTHRYCTKMAKHKIAQAVPYDRDSSFLFPKISAKFQSGHPQWRHQIEVG